MIEQLELDFTIHFTGIGGDLAALITRMSLTGLAAPLDIDYARSWDDFVKILEYEASRAIESTEGTVVGVL
jgi:hypothetical protein